MGSEAMRDQVGLASTTVTGATGRVAVDHKAIQRRRRFRRNVPLLVMFAPVLIWLIVFKYVPMLGISLAFKDFRLALGVFDSPWVGLQNFQLLFTSPLLLGIVWNTLFLSVLSIVAGFSFPIILAVMLNEVRQTGFKRSMQTIFYLPHFLNWVIIGGIVVSVFSIENGPINNFLVALGFEPIPFMYQPTSWITIFVGSGIWKGVGFGSIIYLAAMGTIDNQLYDSAEIDGAGKLGQIWHVTLPGIRPTIVILLILSMNNVMEVGFDQVFMLQNAIVRPVSEVISTFSYRMAISGQNYSITTALGLMESTIGLVLVLATNRFAKRFDSSLW
jgi:putative aldouronate transport system permease protein